MDIIVHTGSTKAGGDVSLGAHAFDGSNGEKVCFLLQWGGQGRMETLERECLNVIRHSLLGSEGEPWHRLDGTLKELNGLFKGVLMGDAVEEIHAVIMLYDATDALHVSHAGRGEAYLIRSGTTSQITEYTRGKPLSAFVHISSGAVEEGDIMVLSTQRLLRTFTPAQLAAIAAGPQAVDEVVEGLESERESASIAVLQVGEMDSGTVSAAPERTRSAVSRRGMDRRARQSTSWMETARSVAERVLPFLATVGKTSAAIGKKGMSLGKSSAPKISAASGSFVKHIANFKQRTETFLADLRHPERKRRAHLLLLAGAVAAFLVILLGVNLLTSTQRSKSRAELADLVQQIESEIRTADNRKLAGDNEAANTILQRAEESAKQVMENDSGLFRTESLDLLDRIRQKREELNNVIRLSPRVLINVASKTPNVSAQGLIGIGDGEMIVYDRQDSYRVLLNRLDDPRRVADDELILDGTYLERNKVQAFLTTGNSLIEVDSSQATSMKTEDPGGWKAGKDIDAYLRYLYILSPDDKQIYKYERLNNRYGPPVPYNVNAELEGSIDMSIDGSVYVLKEGGVVLKLLRGEVQPFTIRQAPADILKTTTKVYKVVDGSFYFLDPENNKVIVIADGGLTGEAAYSKQYVLEGEQLGTLQDLFVDPEENNLYVLDEKRVYAIDLSTR